MKVAVVVLAAGASSRMGQPKQLLPWKGRSLVRHAAESALAADIGPVAVVVGAHGPRVAEELRELPVRCLINERWADGSGTSVRLGTAWALTERARAVVFMLADQPFVGPDPLRLLVSRLREGPESAVAATYAGAVGVPAVFSADLYGELLALPDFEGARALLTGAAELAIPGAAYDVDTPTDYARLTGLLTTQGK